MISSLRNYGHSWNRYSASEKKITRVAATVKEEAKPTQPEDSYRVSQGSGIQSELRRDHSALNHMAESATLLQIIETMLADMDAVLRLISETEEQKDFILFRLTSVLNEAQYLGKPIFKGAYTPSFSVMRDGLLHVNETSDPVHMNAFDGEIPVTVSSAPKKTAYTGIRRLTEEISAQELRFTIKTDKASADIKTAAGSAPEEIVRQINRVCKEQGVEVNVKLTEEGYLAVQHHQWGACTIGLYSSVSGLLNSRDGGLTEICNGQDISGTIGGQKTRCFRNILFGDTGSLYEGIIVFCNEYSDFVLPEPLTEVIQIHSNPIKIYPDGKTEYSFHPENLFEYIRRIKSKIKSGELAFAEFRQEIITKMQKIRSFLTKIRESNQSVMNNIQQQIEEMYQGQDLVSGLLSVFPEISGLYRRQMFSSETLTRLAL